MTRPGREHTDTTAQELLKLGARQLASGEAAAARATFRAGAQRFPSEWRFPCNEATVLHETGAIAAAIRILTQAVQLAPRETFLHHKLGAWLMEIGHAEPAIALLERAVALTAGETCARLHLAVALMEAKQIERAAASIAQALAAEPENAEAHALHGLVLASLGQRAESDAALEHALALDPANAQAAYHLSRHGRSIEDGPLRDRLGSSRASQAERGKLCFALGNVYARRGEHALAFSYYARANALVRRRWNPDNHTALVDHLVATCTAGLFAEREHPELAGRAPIFIVGLPRTGSTLLEQMLGEHPAIHAVGENSAGIPRIARELASAAEGARPYPHGLVDLTPVHRAALAARYDASIAARPSGTRTLDKLLANHQALGLIALLFPDAKVLHCRRDPRDSGLSSYFLEFQRNELPWTYDLEHIARYYADHHRLDRHWKAHLPLDVLDVPYEELVAAPEAWARRVLEFLDLDWDAACLGYAETERPVFTASAMQVREQPHTRAVERWRPYAAHLGPLADVAAAWGC